MTTLVGRQSSSIEYLKKLLELEYDAIGAYKFAISKVEDKIYKKQMLSFQNDHERHIGDLSQILATYNTGVKCPDMKEWLEKMIISMGDTLQGDKGILRAMSYVEKDTNTAYERYTAYRDMEEVVMKTLSQCLVDERKHKDWFDANLNPC